jgi:hypothetical protein
VRDSQATLVRPTFAAIATVLVPLVLALAAVLVRARLHHDLPALLTNDSWDYLVAAQKDGQVEAVEPAVHRHAGRTTRSAPTYRPNSRAQRKGVGHNASTAAVR